MTSQVLNEHQSCVLSSLFSCECNVFFFHAAIQTPLDECQYWADVSVSAKDTEQRDRAQSFVEFLKPLEDAFINLADSQLGEHFSLISENNFFKFLFYC